MRLRSCLVAALAVLFGSIASAQAPTASGPPAEDRTDEAKGLFSAGRAAFEAGRYRDAVDYFRRSYTLSRRAALLYNIAISYDRMSDDAKALEAYEQYLSLQPHASNQTEVESRVAALRAALKPQETQVPAEAEPALSQNEPRARAPTPEQVAISQVQAPHGEPTQARASADRPPEPARATHGSVLSRWWFWTAVGVVVVGGVTATAIGLSGGQQPATPLQPSSGVLVTTLRTAQ